MKIFISITTCFIFFSNTIIAQAPSIQWKKCFGGSNNEFYGCIINTSDGGYFFIGTSNSSSGDLNGDIAGGLAPARGRADYWAVKLTSTGAISWKRNLGGEDDDEAFFALQTSDGGFIVCGKTFSTWSPFPMVSDLTRANKGGSDSWVVKLSASGAIEWERNYGGSSFEHARCIQQTTDGNYIVVGYSSSNDGDLTANYGNYDFWVFKISSTGNLIWQKNYGGSASDYAERIIQTNDGGYIIAGTSISTNGDITGPKGAFDYWVVKISSTGAIEWQKNYGGSGDDIGADIKLTPDGGYVVLGSSRSKDGDRINIRNTGDGDREFWLLKINATGAIIWEKGYGGGLDEASTIELTNDGGYIIAGYTYGGGDATCTQGLSGTNTWLAKISAIGTLQWQSCLGGSKDEFRPTLKQTPDGGFIVMCTTYSNDGDVSGNHGPPTSLFSSDLWVVKLSAAPVTNIRNTLSNNPSIKIYPNPASDFVLIEGKKIVGIIVTDASGKIVWSESYKEPKAKIKLSVASLPKGFYTGFVTNQDKSSNTLKFLKK